MNSIFIPSIPQPNSCDKFFASLAGYEYKDFSVDERLTAFKEGITLQHEFYCPMSAETAYNIITFIIIAVSIFAFYHFIIWSIKINDETLKRKMLREQEWERYVELNKINRMRTAVKEFDSRKKN